VPTLTTLVEPTVHKDIADGTRAEVATDNDADVHVQKKYKMSQGTVCILCTVGY